jgi:hypothetical protein
MLPCMANIFYLLDRSLEFDEKSTTTRKNDKDANVMFRNK